MAFRPTLESIRQSHEDIERLRHIGASALSHATGNTSAADAMYVPETHGAVTNGRRAADHLAAGAAEAIMARSRALADMCEGANATDFGAADKDRDPAVVLSEFYVRLREVKAAHRGDGGVWEEVDANHALVGTVRPAPQFSGEEGGGRYLDLQAFFGQYLNFAVGEVKGGRNGKKRVRGDAAEVKRIDYLDYVKKAVVDHGAVAATVRNSRVYEHYLSGLLEYLVAFAEKLQPLAGATEMVKDAEASLREDLLQRLETVREKFSSVEDALKGMGAGGVRDELLMLGLKCGGRPVDRAARLWEAACGAAKKNQESLGVYNSSSKGRVALEETNSVGKRVVLEGMISFVLGDLLPEELRRTVQNVEKKQSLSWAELEAERVAEEAIADRQGMRDDGEGDGGLDDEQEHIYNPKDVPLGWDGKPIPFWLYKLHGLNHEFHCEICGDASYKGPRAFEKHFADPQHVHGLRCLDISYSKKFFMVTRIADAVKLRAKLQRISKEADFNPDLEIEYEDSSGNVLNRKTYRDLERQGLLS